MQNFWRALIRVTLLSVQPKMGNAGSVNGDSPPLGSTSSDQNYPQNSEGGECREVNDSLPAEFSSKYQAVSKLGSGSFGDVYKVRDNKTKAVYAAKMVDLHRHNTPSEVNTGVVNRWKYFD